MKSVDHVISFSIRVKQSWYSAIQVRGLSAMLTGNPQLDAGMHPAYDGLAGLPFYDDFDLSTVDVLLISQ